VWPKIEKVSWGLPWCSHWFQGVLGAKVDDAREGSWSRCFKEISHTWAPSLSKWGIEVMGQPTLCIVLLHVAVRRGDMAFCQVPSSHIVQQWAVALYRGMQSPWAWILVEVLTVLVPAALSYHARQSMSLLPLYSILVPSCSQDKLNF
jgi:hypothetical protein